MVKEDRTYWFEILGVGALLESAGQEALISVLVAAKTSFELTYPGI